MSPPTPASDPAPVELADVLDHDWLTMALSDVAVGERVVRVDRLGEARTLASKVRFAAEVEDAQGRCRRQTYCVKADFGADSPQTRP